MSESLLKLFKETGAFLSGHFELSSGRHSDSYFQCALLLQHPQFSEKLCKELADKFWDKEAEAVVGPAVGGIIVSFEVARQLGVRSLYAERENGALRLRRNFEIRKGEKLLVVEDVVTTGGSTQEVVQLVRSHGGEVVGVGALVDRSGGDAHYDVPFESLLTLKVATFEKGSCPLCKTKVPFTKPGSRSLASR